MTFEIFDCRFSIELRRSKRTEYQKNIDENLPKGIPPNIFIGGPVPCLAWIPDTSVRE
jgi:hypothetical protein